MNHGADATSANHSSIHPTMTANDSEARDNIAPTTPLPTGERWPTLGIGTWRMGESASKRNAEIAAVLAAIELGYRLIDTAEMYGEGGAEEIVGIAVAEAIRAGTVCRDELFIVTKVYPHHATAKGTIAACARSLARLGLEAVDAYLLHWPGATPIAETVAAFETLRRDGRIRHWGVSNFDVEHMRELSAIDNGDACAINQIYYSLTMRGPAFDLLPWQSQRGVVTMAYSPVDQGALLRHAGLRSLATSLGATPAQVALAWLQRQTAVIAIPKASNIAHLAENLASRALRLGRHEMAELDHVFAPPARPSPLAMR